MAVGQIPARSANTANSVKKVATFWYFGKLSLNFGRCQSSAMQVINLVESINCQAASERARSRPPQSRREICPGVPLEGRISRMRSSGSCVQRRSVLSGSIVRRLCENYRELLQMPKIARFRRALVELNHQISNTRKRAARIHEESRVFTQPLRITDLWTLHGEGPL